MIRFINLVIILPLSVLELAVARIQPLPSASYYGRDSSINSEQVVNVDAYDYDTRCANDTTSRNCTVAQQHCDYTVSSTAAADSTVNHPKRLRGPSAAPSNNIVASGPPLTKGTIVELYANGRSYFATPAIIEGHQVEEGSSSTGSQYHYSLLNAFTNEELPRVDPEFVHPYQAYEDGTRASCNLGRKAVGDNDGDAFMTPCVIVTHSIRKSGLVLYEVSYLASNDDDDALVNDYLPFSRVRRIHDRTNGSVI
mmetsp:Transcript_23123/g.41303  ORF Transcript_23123/g.41303 Transcript_23123/m.41303 type:complete len:253 (+) Transcript_23123:190-948(+)